jgi:hypothetical protein
MNYKTKTQIARIRNQWCKIQKRIKKEFKYDALGARVEMLDSFVEHLWNG